MSRQSPTFALLGQVARYTETLARDSHSSVFVPLAETFRQCGLLREACAVAEKGLQTLPDYAPGYIVLGRIQAQQGHLVPAVASFEAALALEEGNADALKGLARLCSLQGQSSRARVFLLKLLAMNPGDSAAQKMLGTLPADPAPTQVIPPPVPPSGKVAESVLEETKTLRGGRSAPNPHAPISTATIADIYVRQGFTLRALKVYRDLLQADPHNEEIRRKLVELKVRIKREEGTGSTSSSESQGATAVLPPTAAAPVVAVAMVGVPMGAAGALEQLENWLVAIEQRRGHV